MRTVRYQQLVGRKVVAADGQYLGRVADLEAGRRGNCLQVTALLVGPPGWLRRIAFRRTAWFGLPVRRIEWHLIARLDPVVRLRVDLEELRAMGDSARAQV